MDAKDPDNPGAPASIGGVSASHAVIGVGAGTIVMWLTTLLTGFHGLTDAQAGAAAGLLTAGAGAIYLFAAWFIGWKWPSSPPLPAMPASAAVPQQRPPIAPPRPGAPNIPRQT